MFFIKLIFNIYMFAFGCVVLNESKMDDIVRKYPRWFCLIEKVLGYIIFAAGVSIWFW